MSQKCIKINNFLYVAHSFVLAIKVGPVSHIRFIPTKCSVT